jgi:hypothetical protein
MMCSGAREFDIGEFGVADAGIAGNLLEGREKNQNDLR